MCGISCGISYNKTNIVPSVVHFLTMLQSRGYDSYGLGYRRTDGDIISLKRVGQIGLDICENLLIDNFINKLSINVSYPDNCIVSRLIPFLIA